MSIMSASALISALLLLSASPSASNFYGGSMSFSPRKSHDGSYMPNRSPVVTTLPIVRVPRNCPRNYNLLSFDQDHDQVRCRYGVFSASECGMCNQHEGFTLDQSTCTLSYNSASRGVYAFELVMEDYPTQNLTLNYTTSATTVTYPFFHTSQPSSNPPLSKIPLQFALEVEASAPSCVVGEYLPQFMHPTPRHGEHLQARVNQEMEIRVNATATFSTIIDVVFSGPLNSTKENTTSGEYVISWTPTSDDYGQHFPFCFAAEAQSSYWYGYGYGSSRIYQSEMRCVIVMVEAEAPRAQVACTRDTMTVSIERANISGIHSDHLQLNSASCKVSSNSTHVFSTFPLNGCGTQMEETADHLIFKNVIISFDNPDHVITRNNEIEIEVMCKYQKKSNINAHFDTHRPSVTFTERGFGSFSYQFEFYQSHSFTNMRSPSSYPLEYAVGQTIYMKIDPLNVVQNTEVFLESCIATPYDNPNYPISYPIITNGCEVDKTVKIYTHHEPSVKFSMEAFKFIEEYDQVFISCSIIICQSNSPNTRCARGCNNGKALHVYKREVSMQTGVHSISQGPIRLKRSTSQTEPISPSLNLNLVFVAGCVVAVVAMVCGMIIYKSRGSKFNYKLPELDEF